ncbi:MAG: signal peptidase I [Actinomycetota bacterium]|nr:signal peptidase I [Actinomycetota bacterium]
MLFARDILFILLAAILISFGIKTFLVRSFYIPSESMQNTLMVNDRVLVNELEPRLMPVQRGDVIVFTDPGGWLNDQPTAPRATGLAGVIESALDFIGLTASASNDHLIKRVIGVPGDHVACCTADGRMTVNGIPIDEPYVHLPAGVTRASYVDFDVTVPKGELWVMGDNRNNSEDSRYHQSLPTKGFVPISDVVGKAFVITWPVDRWTWLGNYPLTFDGVDARDPR